MIRPELLQVARRWRTVAAALLLAGFGLWVLSLGGFIYGPLGGALALLGAAWGLVEARRARFAQGGQGPGVVELDEGVVRYFGARTLGGEVALRDLAELRLLRLDGQPHWRLRARDGAALLIPVDAAGAEVLADAFAALPGADLGQISAALRPGGPAFAKLWSAPAR